MPSVVDDVMDSFISTLEKMKSKVSTGQYCFYDMVGAHKSLIEKVEKATARLDSLEQRCTTLCEVEQIDNCKAILVELHILAKNLLATPSDEQFRPQLIPSQTLFRGVRTELVRDVVSAYEKCSLETILKTAKKEKTDFQLTTAAYKQLIGYLIIKNGIPKDQAIEFIKQQKLSGSSKDDSIYSIMTSWSRVFKDNYPKI